MRLKIITAYNKIWLVDVSAIEFSEEDAANVLHVFDHEKWEFNLILQENEKTANEVINELFETGKAEVHAQLEEL